MHIRSIIHNKKRKYLNIISELIIVLMCIPICIAFLQDSFTLKHSDKVNDFKHSRIFFTSILY